MRPYNCPDCTQIVFFDDLRCVRSDTDLAFLPSRREVVALDGRTACANRGEIGCSFVVEDDQTHCRSCRLTTARPPADDPQATTDWASAESAKRMLLRQCLSLGIDIESCEFELRSSSFEPVVTGHADGVITIDVNESDDAVRARMRQSMGEAYRTMLGHFRHEIGHYLWMTLVDGSNRLTAFRELFGDERADYQAALDAHYDNPAFPGWENQHVSEYATAHPWEDFAETLGHYLHIRETLDTAGHFGVTVHGTHEALRAPDGPAPDAAGLLDRWLPLALSLNALNRSMGSRPVYPFALAPAVVEKLQWVHELIASHGRESASTIPMTQPRVPASGDGGS